MPASPFVLAIDPTVYVSAFYVWIALSFVWLFRNLLIVRKLRKREAELTSRSPGSGSDTAETVSAPASANARKSEDTATGVKATTPAKPSVSAPPERKVPNAEPTAPPIDASSPAETKAPPTDNVAAPSTPTSAGAPDRLVSPHKRPVPTPDRSVNVPSSVRSSPHASQASPDAALSEESAMAQPPTKPKTSDTIASLLMGIRLPFDLLPTVPAGEQPSDRRVTLVSASAAPEVIGGAVADELERLGYEINTLATDEATAQRDGSSLGLRISPEALDLENSNGRRFPDAQRGSVAIDLWVLDDSAV